MVQVLSMAGRTKKTVGESARCPVCGTRITREAVAACVERDINRLHPNAFRLHAERFGKAFKKLTAEEIASADAGTPLGLWRDGLSFFETILSKHPTILRELDEKEHDQWCRCRRCE